MLSHSRIKANHVITHNQGKYDKPYHAKLNERERERGARKQACQHYQDMISYKWLHPNNQKKRKMKPKNTRKAQKGQTNTY